MLWTVKNTLGLADSTIINRYTLYLLGTVTLMLADRKQSGAQRGFAADHALVDSSVNMLALRERDILSHNHQIDRIDVSCQKCSTYSNTTKDEKSKWN